MKCPWTTACQRELRNHGTERNRRDDRVRIHPFPRERVPPFRNHAIRPFAGHLPFYIDFPSLQVGFRNGMSLPFPDTPASVKDLFLPGPPCPLLLSADSARPGRRQVRPWYVPSFFRRVQFDFCTWCCRIPCPICGVPFTALSSHFPIKNGAVKKRHHKDVLHHGPFFIIYRIIKKSQKSKKAPFPP